MKDDSIVCCSCRTSISVTSIAELLEIGWRPQSNYRFKCPHCLSSTKKDLTNAKRVSTRVRKDYFEQIKAKKKGVEIRKLSDYWDRRFVGRFVPACDLRFTVKPPEVLVLICGNETYRCAIETWWIVDSRSLLIDILGREPSEQGLKDIGREPPWLAMFLGNEVVIEE